MTHLALFMRRSSDRKTISIVCKNNAIQHSEIYLHILRYYFNSLKRYPVLKKLRKGIFKNGCDSLPVLKWNDKFLGSTGYIDRINTSDLSAPMMIGLDIYKRPFLTIAYTYKNNKWCAGCITYFQRFYDCTVEWAWAGCSLNNCGSNRIYKNEIPNTLKIISELIDEENSTFQLLKI